jgi:hypothetical protein
MREVIFKNLTAGNPRRKDILLREVFEKDGVLAKTERRCFYYIKDITRIENQDGLQEWLDAQSGSSTVTKRQFYIFKEHNDAHGEDRLLCKILGTFYVIVDGSVYTIAFLHSFRVTFVKGAISQ